MWPIIRNIWEGFEKGAHFTDYTSRHFIIEGGTLPWAIFRFWLFSNYFSQKFKKIKITVRKNDNFFV